MKKWWIGLSLLAVIWVPPVQGQGLLLPQDSRIAPFPHPIPGPHPLKVQSLEIKVRLQEQVAVTRVTQVFQNDLDFVIEGTYFYPLPENATFVEFATWDGDKKLRGEVLERDEAKARYLSIVRRCWDPGLLEYAGANLFQARVFPVPARGTKRVEFSYSQILKGDSGLIAYTYPLLSGVRANPQAIGRVEVEIDLEGSTGLKNVYSPTQSLDIRREGEKAARIRYEARDLVPDRNFQLFYALSDADVGLTLLTYRESGEDGYFMLMVSPRSETTAGEVLAKDILFVLDTSGSMQDRGKLDKALAALRFGVRSLNSRDRFNIVTFSTEARQFREGLVPASGEMREAAERFLERQGASGGTNIRDALRQGLESFREGDRPAYLVFLTDGLPTVGETDPGKILKEISSLNRRGVRLFSFGVGYDVNTFLLDQLGARNAGATDYVTPEEDLEVKLSNFFAKVASPVLTGLVLNVDAMRGSEVYPGKLPDLFRGSQITVLGRYAANGRIPLTLRGSLQGRVRTLTLEDAEFPGNRTTYDFLPRLWAMRKVGYLLEQIRMSGANEELKDEIVRLAKKYGFVTPYTSYLAADESDLQTLGRRKMSLSPAGATGGAPASPALAREAVTTSMVLNKMKTADVAVSPVGSAMRFVAGKSFARKDGGWIDASYDPRAALPVVDLKFGSEDLIRAIAADPDLAAFAALGENVIVVHKGKVYRIRK